MAGLRSTAAKRRGGNAPAPSRRSKTTPTTDGELSDRELRRLIPAGIEASFVKSKLHDKALGIAGLGEPGDWDGDMPEIPPDIGTIDHEQMANLLGDLANALSTALWQASKAYIEADAYGEIAEYLEDIAMLDADESNEAKRKAQARTDQRVVAAKALERTAYHNYVRFRDLGRTIEHKWRTVSRVGGFIGDEAEAEAAGAIKRSTRGQAAGSAKGTAKGSGRARSSR
jgi:hypothetical protein